VDHVGDVVRVPNQNMNAYFSQLVENDLLEVCVHQEFPESVVLVIFERELGRFSGTRKSRSVSFIKGAFTLRRCVSRFVMAVSR
jgi:hypothetical protein